MKIVCVGGGPAGLYFAILMKLEDPEHDILVLERNRPDDTFGFGVVFSDATLEQFAEADRPSHDAITQAFYHWDDIDIHYAGECLSSSGHGFSGLSRRRLLEILVSRCEELGVRLEFGVEVESLADFAGADLIVAADGANSVVRARRAEAFGPNIDERPNRFVWLGTSRPFPAFTFYFRENEHGMWRVHAYQYTPTGAAGEPISTFIVEATEETWRASGMDAATERETVDFLEALFAEELDGHRLTANRSIWRRFPTIRNRTWRDGNVVLPRTRRTSRSGRARASPWSTPSRCATRYGSRPSRSARSRRTRPRGVRRWRVFSARRRRASSGSRRPSASWRPHRSSSRSTS